MYNYNILSFIKNDYKTNIINNIKNDYNKKYYNNYYNKALFFKNKNPLKTVKYFLNSINIDKNYNSYLELGKYLKKIGASSELYLKYYFKSIYKNANNKNFAYIQLSKFYKKNMSTSMFFLKKSLKNKCNKAYIQNIKLLLYHNINIYEYYNSITKYLINYKKKDIYLYNTLAYIECYMGSYHILNKKTQLAYNSYLKAYNYIKLISINDSKLCNLFFYKYINFLRINTFFIFNNANLNMLYEISYNQYELNNYKLFMKLLFFYIENKKYSHFISKISLFKITNIDINNLNNSKIFINYYKLKFFYYLLHKNVDKQTYYLSKILNNINNTTKMNKYIKYISSYYNINYDNIEFLNTPGYCSIEYKDINYSIKLKCNHVFSIEIFKWFNVKQECPLCRCNLNT